MPGAVLVTPLDILSERFPGLAVKVADRLVSKTGLFDTEKHRLRRDVSGPEEARAILLVACHTALQCGYRLNVTAEEARILHMTFTPVRQGNL